MFSKTAYFHTGSGVHSSLGQALLQCSIPAPLLMEQSSKTFVFCDVSLTSAAFSIRSGGSASASSHLKGRFSSIQSPFKTPLTLPPSHNPHTVRTLLGPSTLRITPLVTGSAQITVDSRVHTSGHLNHPAVVDNCLHIGASLASLGAPVGETPPARVPVSLGAYCAFEELSGASGWANACIEGVTPDGSALSSYRFVALPSAAAFEMSQLQAKTIGAAPAASAAKTAASGLYGISWQADAAAAAPAGSRYISPAAAIGPEWAFDGRRLMLSRGSMSSGPLCLASLQALQSAIRVSAASVSGTTRGVIPTGAPGRGAYGIKEDTAATGAAAVWGLVRVAAAENPKMRCTSVDVPPEAPFTPLATGSDGFGCRVVSGVGLSPKLVEDSAGQHSTGSGADLRGLAGRVVISGGLGGNYIFASSSLNLLQSAFKCGAVFLG